MEINNLRALLDDIETQPEGFIFYPHDFVSTKYNLREVLLAFQILRKQNKIQSLCRSMK